MVREWLGSGLKNKEGQGQSERGPLGSKKKKKAKKEELKKFNKKLRQHD